MTRRFQPGKLQSMWCLGMVAVSALALQGCSTNPVHSYYYGNSAPHYGHRHEHYREAPRQEYRREAPRHEAPARIPSPLEVHRDVRRSLGLPRLPGMP